MAIIAPIKEWKMPEILFVAAACFAMAAVGFFIAVYLLQVHRLGGPAMYANSSEVPVELKANQLNALSQSAPEPQSASVPPSESQADSNDALAAQKLKLLQQMSSSK